MKISTAWFGVFGGRKRKTCRRRRLSLELLEPRQLLTTLQLTPVADDTLYQDPAGNLSNGVGQHLFVGTTGQNQNSVRRGVVKFNLAALPVGASITGAILTLNMSKTPSSVAQNVAVHRALRDWGEGTSNAALGGAGAGEGDGTQATSGDVTWLYTFYHTSTWTTPGGDFVAIASASPPSSVRMVGVSYIEIA